MWSVLAILLLTVSPLYAQTLTHTNGSSGEPCPDKKCLAGRADCVNSVCECRPPFQLVLENGDFACYRSNQVFGEVRNDPTVRNFNNETASFQYPCRYLLTSTTTTLRIQKQNQGTCRCVLHGWNGKWRGKFFFGGFDFACLIHNTVLKKQLGFSVRIYGVADGEHYTYTEYSVNQFKPDGPWTTAPLFAQGAGITVQSSYDLENNQARLIIPECGWQISLLAYDIVERQGQDQIPGLSFAVNCGLDPFFLEHNRSIATAPEKFGGTKYKDLATPPRTVPEELLIIAFKAHTVQNHPDASPLCSTVGDYLNQCTDEKLSDAARGCFWMLDEPRFIRCLDRETNVTPVLAVLQKCIAFYCDNGVTCPEYVEAVTETECGGLPNIPRLAEIVNEDICNP